MSDAGAKLIAAIEAQDVHATATLLAGGADPNSHDEYDRTALGAATGKARWGDPARGLEILRRLLTAGADPNRVGEHQTPPLIEAAYRGDDEVCRALVEGGADVAARERGGDRHTALLAAASGALPWLLELCLEAGARVDDVSAQGHTVMHYAVSLPSYVEGKAARFEAVAERLRSAGAALEVVNGEWGAPLHWAAGSGNVRGVAWLLARGCSIEQATPAGARPLHEAAARGAAEVVGALAGAGAALDAADALGRAPLHHACERPQYTGDAVERLLACGAAVDARDGEGRTPLSVALASKKTGATLKRDEARVLAALLRAGATADVKTRSRTTPLHLLARVGEAALLEQAIARGAPLDAFDKHGWTALHQACARPEPGCARALLAAGADRVAGTRRARTLKKRSFPAGARPHDIAAAFGHDDVAALFTTPGA